MYYITILIAILFALPIFLFSKFKPLSSSVNSNARLSGKKLLYLEILEQRHRRVKLNILIFLGTISILPYAMIMFETLNSHLDVKFNSQIFAVFGPVAFSTTVILAEIYIACRILLSRSLSDINYIFAQSSDDDFEQMHAIMEGSDLIMRNTFPSFLITEKTIFLFKMARTIPIDFEDIQKVTHRVGYRGSHRISIRTSKFYFFLTNFYFKEYLRKKLLHHNIILS